MEITLRKGGLEARADPMGGELVSLRDGAYEYIWNGDPAYWSGRNPILFPIVGALRNETVRIGQTAFHMARHGFARRRMFSVAAQGADFVEFCLREDPDTLAQYPYPFVLSVRHTLTEDGFKTRFCVENPGRESMLFCIGGHTAFRCPIRPGEQFEDYRLVFEREEDAWALLPGEGGCLSQDRREHFLPGTDTIPLRHEVFDRVDTLVFEGLRSKTVRLEHRDGHGVEVDFGAFPMVAFWTMPGVRAPYICIEPWQGCGAFEQESGQFSDKHHCVTLEPGGHWQAVYEVRLLRR